MKSPFRLPRLALPGRSGAPPSPVLAPYRRFSPRWPLRLLCAAVLFAAAAAWGAVYVITFPYWLVPLMVPAVVLATLVIWALPETKRAPVGLLVPFFIAFTAAMYLWPNYLAIAIPGLPWLTLLRIFGTPMAMVLLVCVSTSSAFRKQIGSVLGTDPLIWRLLVGFGVIEFLSIAFSPELGNSLARFSITLTNWYAVFFVSCYVFSRPGTAGRWAILLWSCAVVLCFIAIWEARLGRPPWAGHIPPFLRVDDPAVLRTLAGSGRGGLTARRVAATTAHPLILAEFLGLMVPFAVHFVLQKYPIWLRVGAALSLPLIAYAIMLTDSRLGVGAELLSIVIYLFMWAALRWQRTKSSIFAPALVLAYPAIFCMFVAATFAVGQLRARVWGGGAAQPSTQARIDQWHNGMPKVLAHPWGYGIGRGGDVLGFVNGAGTLTIDTYYLNVLLEYGVLGFAVYFGMFARGVWVAGRAGVASKATGELLLLIPISIALVNFIIIKSVMASEANHPVLFMMLGATLALAARVRAADQSADTGAETSKVKPAWRQALRTAGSAPWNRR